MDVHLIPGVSPGKNTPIVKTFLNNKETASFSMQAILNTTLNPEKTMTEKMNFLKNYVVHVRPIAWYGKTFSQSQVLRYQSMEYIGTIEESLALFFNVSQ